MREKARRLWQKRLGAGALAADEEIPQEGNAEGEGKQHEILEQARPLIDAFVLAVGFRFLRSHDSRDVLQKIDAALFADSSVALFVFARRTLKTQCCVASAAEPRDVARLGAAPGA